MLPAVNLALWIDKQKLGWHLSISKMQHIHVKWHYLAVEVEAADVDVEVADDVEVVELEANDFIILTQSLQPLTVIFLQHQAYEQETNFKSCQKQN